MYTFICFINIYNETRTYAMGCCVFRHKRMRTQNNEQLYSAVHECTGSKKHFRPSALWVQIRLQTGTRRHHLHRYDLLKCCASCRL